MLHEIANSVQDLRAKQIIFETGNWNINKVYHRWHQKHAKDELPINVVGVFLSTVVLINFVKLSLFETYGLSVNVITTTIILPFLSVV